MNEEMKENYSEEISEVETESQNEEISEEKKVEMTSQSDPEAEDLPFADAEEDSSFQEELKSIREGIETLQETFQDKIAQDEYKNELFDNMHQELVRYQNGLMDQLVNAMALDIIQLADSTMNHAAHYGESEPSEENYKKLVKIVKGIYEDLQDILYRQGIEPYTVNGDVVDVKKQKIIANVSTDNPEQNNLIAERTAEGYEKDGKIIRPERIKIYKFKETQSDTKEG